MKFGKNFKQELNNLHIGGSQIVWTDKVKYLGVYVYAGRNSACVVRKFYAAANAIYSHTMNVHEMPRLCLFESFTLPLLTYGCDGLLLPRVYVNKLNVCWYNVYRKVFNMRMWDLVKEIQLYCERLDLVRILHKRSFNF